MVVVPGVDVEKKRQSRCGQRQPGSAAVCLCEGSPPSAGMRGWIAQRLLWIQNVFSEHAAVRGTSSVVEDCSLGEGKI